MKRGSKPSWATPSSPPKHQDGRSPSVENFEYKARDGGVTSCAFEVRFDRPEGGEQPAASFGNFEDYPVNERLIDREVDELFSGMSNSRGAGGSEYGVYAVGWPAR